MPAAHLIQPRSEPPVWRLLAGVGIALALAVGLLFALMRANPGEEDLALASVSAVHPPRATPRPQVAEPPAVTGARDALTAWGKFAISGDLNEVRPNFAQTGPQYLRLQSEAGRLSADPMGPPVYSFEFPTPTVIPLGRDRAIVRGVVMFSRPGEPVRTFHWDLKMLWSDAKQRWLLWTVSRTAS